MTEDFLFYKSFDGCHVIFCVFYGLLVFFNCFSKSNIYARMRTRSSFWTRRAVHLRHGIDVVIQQSQGKERLVAFKSSISLVSGDLIFKLPYKTHTANSVPVFQPPRTSFYPYYILWEWCNPASSSQEPLSQPLLQPRKWSIHCNLLPVS